MPESRGITISLQSWDPKVFEAKPEDGKTLNEIESQTSTTDKPLMLLNGDHFKDAKYREHKSFKGTDFKGTMEYHMVKAGKGLFENKEEHNPVVGSDDSIMVDQPVREVGAQPDSFHTVKKFPPKYSPSDPKALRILVKFSKGAFIPRRELFQLRPDLHDQVPTFCINIFYNGGFVDSRVINDYSRPEDDEHFRVMSFSGRRNGGQIEFPFVIYPSESLDTTKKGVKSKFITESKPKSKVTQTNTQRWEAIGNNLLKDTEDNWLHSDMEDRTSLMEKTLKYISKLKMPSDMIELRLEDDRRKFGVIDVVIVAGVANIRSLNLNCVSGIPQ